MSPKLSTLMPGDKAVIVGFNDSPLSQRMMEMGLTPGAQIEVAYEAPFGGAIAIRCRGSLIALRNSDADSVDVRVE